MGQRDGHRPYSRTAKVINNLAVGLCCSSGCDGHDLSGEGMPGKRKKEQYLGWTLPEIEEWARMDGLDILLAPHTVKVVRTIKVYEPYQQGGPGRWRPVHIDDVTEAAIEAAQLFEVTADMISSIRPEDFKRGKLKKRLAVLEALKT